MKPYLQLLAIVACLTFLSCQKEISWDIIPSTGGGGTGGGSTGGGNTDGDLLVKAVAITEGTTDTNVVTLTWDANKKLTQYKSTGRTNGFDASAQYDIIRHSNGNIQKINSKPFAPFGGFAVDSIVTYTYYQSTSNKLQYAITTTYTSIMDKKDSVVLTYNAAGYVTTKKVYSESIITGSMDLQIEETYTYDANGNLTHSSTSMADPLTGVLSAAGTTTMSYNTHKGPSRLGEEAFLILSVENVSPNYTNTKIQSGTSGGGGTSIPITATLSNTLYNSFDRPIKGTITTTPTPPGYKIHYTYYYQ